MNPERCEYLAGDELIKIIPRFNEPILHLVCGDVGPLEAGIACTVPLWLAVLLRKKEQCRIVPPEWMDIEELRRYLVAESEMAGLAKLPHCIFEIAHLLVWDAKEDIEDCDQVKILIKDLQDKREAKLRSSSLKFISQHVASHARMDNVQPLEVASACSRATQAATRAVARLVSKTHDLQD